LHPFKRYPRLQVALYARNEPRQLAGLFLCRRVRRPIGLKIAVFASVAALEMFSIIAASDGIGVGMGMLKFGG
jgi:hypothetical protein